MPGNLESDSWPREYGKVYEHGSIWVRRARRWWSLSGIRAPQWAWILHKINEAARMVMHTRHAGGYHTKIFCGTGMDILDPALVTSPSPRRFL